MQALQELLANRVLISGLVGWGAAQVLKTIIYALMHHTLDLTRIFGDGGMPSGHSATVCAVATSAGILYGLGSFPFAISVIVAIIVMHDAMGVRLETGKQAKLLNEFIDLFAKLERRSPIRKSSRSSWGIRRCRSAWALCSASPPAFCAISARETRKNLTPQEGNLHPDLHRTFY